RRRCAGDPLTLCLAAKSSRFRIILWRCRATAHNGITLLRTSAAVGKYSRISAKIGAVYSGFHRCVDVSAATTPDHAVSTTDWWRAGFRPLDRVLHDAAMAIAAIDEVPRSRGVPADHRPLAAIGLIVPHACQQCMAAASRMRL